MALLLYLATTAAILYVWRRFVQPITLVAAALLVVLPCVLVGPALVTGGVYGPADLPYLSEPLQGYAKELGLSTIHNGTLSDLYTQIMPWRKAVRYAIAHGEWPLLNPFMLCGDILAAAAQPAPYDPFNLLSLVIPLGPAITYAAAMTFFLAAFFTFAFARAIGCSEGASLVAAAGWMLSGLVTMFAGWPLARAWSFLPFVLFAVRAVARDASLHAGVLLTTAFVLTILAGHPESVLHVVFVGVLYGVYELFSSPRGRTWRGAPDEGRRDGSGADAPHPALRATLSRGERAETSGQRPEEHAGRAGLTASRSPLAAARVAASRAPLKAAGVAALCGLIALLLTAFFLLPFLWAARETVEYEQRDSYRSAAWYNDPTVTARRLGGALLPFFGGQPWRGNTTSLWDPQFARVGSVILALALIALVTAWRRRDTWFFFALAVFCTLAFALAWPVAPLLHELPLFDIALNERLGFAAAFAVCILAAIGVDSWTPKRATLIAVAVMIAIVAASASVWNAQLKAGVFESLMSAQLVFELAPLLLLVMLFLERPPLPRAALLLGLVVFQRVSEDGSIYPTVRAEAFYPPVKLFEQIDRTQLWRVAGAHFAMIPQMATMYELEDPRGYEAMTYRRLAQTYHLWSVPQAVSFNNVSEIGKPLLAMMNVRYFVTSPDVQPPNERWRVVADDRGARLLENTDALPRAYLPRIIHYVRDEHAMLRGLSLTTDFAEHGYVLAPELTPHEIHNGAGTVTSHRDGLACEIDARLDNDAWVFVSQSAWDGWRAYVDGKRVNPKYANHAFLAVFVPKGAHKVRLVYVPEAFTRGRNVSAITLAVLIAFGVRRHSRRHRTPNSEDGGPPAAGARPRTRWLA